MRFATFPLIGQRSARGGIISAKAKHKTPHNPKIQSILTPLRKHRPMITGPTPCPNEIRKNVIEKPEAGAQSNIRKDHIPKNAVVTMNPTPKTAADA